MKNLNYLFNALVVVAIAVLFYLHFSSNNSSSKKRNRSVEAAAISSTGKSGLFAYVDLDSLNEKITFIKQNRAKLEQEQAAIESEWQKGYQNLQQQRDQFIKKGGSSITQQQAEEFQSILIQQQQQIDGKKQTLTQKLNEKSYKFMDGVQKQLKDFLAEYNQDKGFNYIFTTGNGLEYMVYKDSSLNITNDVVEGMNEKLK
jgi:outer membrane protein